MGSLVLSREVHDYRKLAQKHYGLTDEQMSVVDVHHNPPRCEGGRNIPEHLFIYHPTLHKAVHDKEARGWAKKSSGNRHGKRGRPSKKGTLRPIEVEVGKLSSLGLSRKEIQLKLNLKEHQVKRAVSQCRKWGLVVNTKPGPKKGTPQRGGVPKGTKQPNQYTKRG